MTVHPLRTEDVLPDYSVQFDEKGKMVLPSVPSNHAELCRWLTAVFALDAARPIVGGARQGVAGPDGHVALRRADAPDLRFEPASRINQPPRLIETLCWGSLPSDGAVPAFKAEHCRMIALVIRQLCGVGEQLSAEDEAAGVVGTFLGAAQPVEGYSTHGTAPQRFEAATALQRGMDEASGRPLGPPRYLIDADTGELVIRVSDLGFAARAHVGSSLARGWLDGRMDLIGWQRVRLSGYSHPGREGRRIGMHMRCDVYRGLLPAVDESEAVNT